MKIGGFWGNALSAVTAEPRMVTCYLPVLLCKSVNRVTLSFTMSIHLAFSACSDTRGRWRPSPLPYLFTTILSVPSTRLITRWYPHNR